MPKNRNVKQKQYCNKFNEDFKNGSHKKKIFIKRWLYVKIPSPFSVYLHSLGHIKYLRSQSLELSLELPVIGSLSLELIYIYTGFFAILPTWFGYV